MIYFSCCCGREQEALGEGSWNRCRGCGSRIMVNRGADNRLYVAVTDICRAKLKKEGRLKNQFPSVFVKF